MSTSTPETGAAQRRKGHHGPNVGHHHRDTAHRREQVHMAGLAEAQQQEQGASVRAAAPAAAPHRKGHHGHHGGHHHHAPNGTSAVPGVTAPVPHQNATSGVVSRVSTHPPGAVVAAPVIHSPPPPEHHAGMSGGAIFGLVICILAVFGVAGFVVYKVWRKRNHRDPMFTMAPGHRGGYWGRRDSHSHIVSPPPDDDIASFDQDFKHWVEVVGSASGKPFPANNASTKYYNNNNNNSTGSSASNGLNNAKRPTLNRIPSGVEPVGSTENGTLVFQDTPKIKVDRSSTSDTGSMVNEPVSPLKAPPGFGPFGGPVMKLEPPPNPPTGVRAPPFQH